MLRSASTWIAAVFALACGFGFGVLLTVAHPATATIDGWTAPVGLVVGSLVLALLLVGIRLVSLSRVPAIAAALGFFAAEVWISLPDVGGGVLASDGAADAVWGAAPAFIAVIVCAWPGSSRTSRAGRSEARR